MTQFLPLAAFLLAGQPAPAAAADPIDRIILDSLQAWKAPGASVAIVHGSQPPLFRSHGIADIQTREPLGNDHLFPIASCTKAFTATLVAKLADEGRLSFDDPVRKHLPGFELSDPNASALVTLRDLLSHRTGVSGHDLLWYRSPLPQAEIVSRIRHLPLVKPFRGAYQYSTLMYMAAGQAAANAAGEPWDAALRQRLLVPLGMGSAALSAASPEFGKAARASGHLPGPDGRPVPMPRYAIDEPNPAGSLHLSIRDLAPWLALHLHGGMHAGRTIVSEANLRETHAPQIVIRMDDAMQRYHPDTVQMAYAMGWIVSDYRGLRLLSHGGMIDGFRIHVLLVPDKQLGIAIFNNQHDTKMNLALANALTDHLLELPPRDWNAIIRKAMETEAGDRAKAWERQLAERGTLRAEPSQPLEAFAGTYHNDAYGEAVVSLRDGRLHWAWSTFTAPLEHWGSDGFRCTDGFLAGQSVEFSPEGKSVPALTFQGLRFTRRP